MMMITKTTKKTMTKKKKKTFDKVQRNCCNGRRIDRLPLRPEPFPRHQIIRPSRLHPRRQIQHDNSPCWTIWFLEQFNP
jgi:hypothetical protein